MPVCYSLPVEMQCGNYTFRKWTFELYVRRSVIRELHFRKTVKFTIGFFQWGYFKAFSAEYEVT